VTGEPAAGRDDSVCEVVLCVCASPSLGFREGVSAA